jgi:ribonuclease P protein component
LIDGIHERSVFERFRREGVRVSAGTIGVTYLPLDSARPQVAFAIGRRCGSAVVRNRCRRRLREHLRRRAGVGALRHGAYLVMVSPAAGSADKAELTRRIDDALDKLDRRLAS